MIQKIKISHLFTTSSFANRVVVSNIHGSRSSPGVSDKWLQGFPTFFIFPLNVGEMIDHLTVAYVSNGVET